MPAPVILVDASPRRAADGMPVPVRLAGGGAAVPYHYGGAHYDAGIAGLPRSIASLGFDGEQLGGGGVAQALELRWSPGSARSLDKMAALVWTDAPITVRIGAEGVALPPVDVAGLVLEVAVDDGALRIVLADQTTDLQRSLLTDRFDGSGGIEGPIEWDGQVRSRAWGRCFNIPGRAIKGTIWCFGDPRRPWQGFVQVRTRGVAIETLTLLEWQGSPEATFAALDAAVVAAGTAIACPSIACVKWWTDADNLHADILGETAGGYVETAAAIAARIVAARSTLTIDAAELAAAIAARPEPFGWRVDTDSATAAGELTELLAGVSLSWLIVDGKVAFRPWAWTAPHRTARSHGVTRRQVYKPVATRKLGYRRNWSPMARGDLAGIVLIEDVIYEDGRSARDVLDEAVDRATQASSDGWLTPAEKRRAVIDLADLVSQRDAVTAKYVELGSPADIVTRRDQAHARYADLVAYLGTLVPAWDDASVATPVVAATYRTRWTAAAAALNAFAAAITGRAGRDALTADLTNQGHIVPALHDGTVTSYAGAEGVFFVQSGTVNLTDSGQFDLSVVANPQALAITIIGRYFRVDGGMDVGEDSATVTFRLTGSGAFTGVEIDKTFSLTKSKGGADGSPAPLWTLGAVPQLIRFDTTGAIIPGQSVRFTFLGTNIAAGTATVWRLSNVDGSPLIQANSAADFVQQAGPAYWQSPDPATLICTEAGVAYMFATHGGAVGRWLMGAVPFGRAEFETVAILKIRDGAKGIDGINPPVVTVTATPQAIGYDKDNQLASGPVTFMATLQNAIGPVSWASTGPHQLYNFPGVTFNGTSMTLSPERMRDILAYNEVTFGTASETIVASASGVSARVTVTKIKDGTAGADGFAVGTPSPVFIIPAFPSGAPKPSWQGGASTIVLRKGQGIITAGVTYALEGAVNMANLALSGSTFSFSGITSDAGYFTIAAAFEGTSYRARVDAKKVYDGSPAFRGGVTVGGGRATGFEASGTTPVPGGSTVRVSVGFGYSSPDPRGRETLYRGRASLYCRNVTDNGDQVFLGAVTGSDATTINRGTDTEQDYERTDGYVGAAFTFASASADKVYEYRVLIAQAAADPAVIVLGSGELRLEVVG